MKHLLLYLVHQATTIFEYRIWHFTNLLSQLPVYYSKYAESHYLNVLVATYKVCTHIHCVMSVLITLIMPFSSVATCVTKWYSSICTWFVGKVWACPYDIDCFILLYTATYACVGDLPTRVIPGCQWRIIWPAIMFSFEYHTLIN